MSTNNNNDKCPCHGVAWQMRKSGVRQCFVKKRESDNRYRAKDRAKDAEKSKKYRENPKNRLRINQYKTLWVSRKRLEGARKSAELFAQG